MFDRPLKEIEPRSPVIVAADLARRRDKLSNEACRVIMRLMTRISELDQQLNDRFLKAMQELSREPPP